MFWELYEITFAGRPMQYLKFWYSDNPACTENCDSCIGYTVYDSGTLKETDGGEMDYDSNACAHEDLAGFLADLVDFVWDGRKPESCVRSCFDAGLLEDA